MKEKMNIIRVLLMVMMILVLITSACSLVSSLLKNLPGIRTVFTADKIPDKTQSHPLIFFAIDWPWESKLTIQGYGSAYYPSFIGDITVGNILPFYLNNSILVGEIPLLSKDGGYLAFQSAGKMYIVAANKVASNNYSITSDSYVDVLDVELPCNHAWSTDSRHLASVCHSSSGVTISLYDLTKKSIQDIFEYPEKDIGEIERVSWSPDRTMLAFSLRYDYEGQPSQSDVFIYHFDMKSLTKITNTPGNEERNPTWYPRGNILTFTDTKVGDAESLESNLVFSTADGRCMKILPNIRGIMYPAWSPDGSQLAYIEAWLAIKVLDVSQLIPSDYLSPQGLCGLQ